MAERARARSGYAVAARALERAAQLTPAPRDACERALAAADAFWRAGRGSRAEQLLTGVARGRRATRCCARTPSTCSGALSTGAAIRLAAREILVAGALRVEPADRRRAADLMASALHSSWLSGRRELVRETAATLARMVGRSRHPATTRGCAR